VSWRRGRIDEPLVVEVEIVRERAEALGRAGCALHDAIAAYRAASAAAGGSLRDDEEERHLTAITASLYRLVIQRECAGARNGNLDAIRAAYDVPEVVFRRL
jgi:hypothetical protein